MWVDLSNKRSCRQYLIQSSTLIFVKREISIGGWMSSVSSSKIPLKAFLVSIFFYKIGFWILYVTRFFKVVFIVGLFIKKIINNYLNFFINYFWSNQKWLILPNCFLSWLDPDRMVPDFWYKFLIIKAENYDKRSKESSFVIIFSFNH